MNTRDTPPTPADVLAADRSPAERVLLVWDLAIVALVLINLALIIVDLLYSLGPINHAAAALAPGMVGWYGQRVHAHFGTIDLLFVSVFVVDVLAGWVVAVAQARYYRWYFYPFVRWYDVLGCVPVAGLRFLRVLRVISIMMRLQRLSVIDIRRWWLYRQLAIYYDIVVEEISDRVVINVLSGAQTELRSGGQTMTRRIVAEVIAPRQDKLTAAISSQLENAVVAAYDDNREQLQAYVSRVVSKAIDANPALTGLERVPMLGSFVSHALDAAIRDAVNNVLDEAVAGLDSKEFDALVADVVDSVIQRTLDENAQGGSAEVREAIIQTLELVKDQVAIKRWHAHFE